MPLLVLTLALSFLLGLSHQARADSEISIVSIPTGWGVEIDHDRISAVQAPVKIGFLNMSGVGEIDVSIYLEPNLHMFRNGNEETVLTTNGKIEVRSLGEPILSGDLREGGKFYLVDTLLSQTMHETWRLHFSSCHFFREHVHGWKPAIVGKILRCGKISLAHSCRRGTAFNRIRTKLSL